MSSLAKQNQKTESAQGGLLAELFRVGLYKPNQGRVVRQVTFFALALLSCFVAWELKVSSLLSGLGASSILVMVLVAAALVWVSYRVVNYAVFADFLISVEAEMNKVSWPTRKELWNASLVVIFVIFAMAFFLFLFDAIWTLIFEGIGIRYSKDGSLFSKLYTWISG
ncbi:MAG: preprotein translocase subunit SecE [Planctomycetota bacterium]